MSDQDTPTNTGLSEQHMRQALWRELMREVAQENGEGATKLELIARKLADRAVDGDMPAVKEVFDRIDGKSLAGVEPVDPEPQETVLRWGN